MRFLKPIFRKKIEALKAEREAILRDRVLYPEPSFGYKRLTLATELWGLKIVILEALSE